MRTILVVIFLLFYFLLGSIVLGIEWLVGKFNPYRADLHTLRFVQWGFRCVMFLSGVKLEVEGHEKVPKDEAVLYVGNHRGMFDVVASYSLCPGLTGYISKEVVSKIPFLHLFMVRVHCLFFDRSDIKKGLKMILEAIDKVKKGISICIYPEGTRCKDLEHPQKVLPFKSGSFKIAQKTGCKIVPMAISGTAEILEKHMPWIHKGTIKLTYGDPFTIKELEKEDQKHIGDYCQKIISQMLEEQLHVI